MGALEVVVLLVVLAALVALVLRLAGRIGAGPRRR